MPRHLREPGLPERATVCIAWDCRARDQYGFSSSKLDVNGVTGRAKQAPPFAPKRTTDGLSVRTSSGRWLWSVCSQGVLHPNCQFVPVEASFTVEQFE